MFPNPPFSPTTIPGQVVKYLSERGFTPNYRMIGYYRKGRYAINSITNGQKRPSSMYTSVNYGKDRIVLEAALNVRADFQEFDFDLDLHHMEPYSEGGGSHISNLRLVPSCVNRFIGTASFSEREIEEFCQVIAQTAIGKANNIPYWYKCCRLEEFIDLAAEHTGRKSLCA